MLSLHYSEDDKRKVFPLEEGKIVIGRDESCDIVIHDFTISRQHLAITSKSGVHRVEDLQSRNGIKLNGLTILRAVLRDGDRLEIGNTLIEVRSELQENGIIISNECMKQEGTIIRPIKDIEGFLSGKSEAHDLQRENVKELEEENKLLMVLTQVARALLSVEPLEKTLDRVMDLVFRHIPADRGFLMLDHESTGELVPYIIKNRNMKKSKGISFSKTIARKVMNEKVAILSTDVQTDPRFKDGESIKIMGIHSAMCVPLWLRDKVIGIIHLDSPVKDYAFKERDIDLLSALANYAAVAIERARLNEQFEREKEMKQRLERYHSPIVVEQIINSGNKSGGYNLRAVEREVTVLFADIVGFTTLAEGMSPNDISLFLNEYFSTMTDAVFAHKGMLDKYIGDSVMAVFGAPISQEDHAANAVRAAFEMMENIKSLNSSRKDGMNIKLHIGINSGPVVAGDIGSLKRVDYTVLGCTVNIASRLQDEAGSDQILAGEQTFKFVEDLVEAEHIGDRNMKGIANKLPVYLLKSLGKL